MPKEPTPATPSLKVYFATDFHELEAPSAAVVVAESQAHAAELLNDALEEENDHPRTVKAKQMIELEVDVAHANLLVME